MKETWIEVSERAVLVVDGACLCRPELRDDWDDVIGLDVDPETMIARARARDVAWVGSEEVMVDQAAVVVDTRVRLGILKRV